jgi:aspartate-semialdehyde dehydrogenase
MKAPRLAVVGATGIVGKTTLDVFEEWETPLASLRLFSSAGSSGQRIEFRRRSYVVEELAGVPEAIDVAIFATSSTLSAQWVPIFRDAGITVIDHSSYFRMHKDVPLVIPEINAYALKNHKGIIANPNCSASVMLLPLFGLHRAFGLRQIITSTYQSVSGAGRAASEELDRQTVDTEARPEVFPVRIAANVIPQIGSFDESGVSGEEEKVGNEIRKILSAPDVYVLATTVRVPVHIGHSASVAVQLEKPVAISEAREAMRGIPGLVFDESRYYTPLEIAGKQEVFAGRLRVDSNRPDWLQFWVVGDNLRKGAASNAVQILEVLYS